MSAGGYCLNEAICSIFVWSILLILSNIKYFRGIDTAFTKQYALFPKGIYCFYNVIRNILEGSILLMIRKYTVFPGGGYCYIKEYAVFSGRGHCLYLTNRGIFMGSTLRILEMHSIFGGWILLLQSNTQQFRRMDTAYTYQYKVFPWGRYCLY